MWREGRSAHRDEEDASEQRAGQRCFHNLLQTRVGCLVTFEQGWDVKGQLCDGAEAGVHHCTHSKVTLGWDTAGAENDRQLTSEALVKLFQHFLVH